MSPRCPRCQRRSLRFRKRTNEFVCRKCKHTFAKDEVQRPPDTSDAERLRAVEALGPDAREMVWDLLSTIEAILAAHEPKLGHLVPVLAVATASIAGVTIGRTLAWYWAVPLSFVAGLAFGGLLWIGRLLGYAWRHPLLVRMRLALMGIEMGDAVTDESFRLVLEVLDAYADDEDRGRLLGALQIEAERDAEERDSGRER